MTERSVDVDVAIVGSGAAGLTAAIVAHHRGARVAILERSDKVGGTTAVSGGGVWVPCNHHMTSAGIEDSREEALAYCKTLTAGAAADDLVEAFVDAAPEMLRYVEEHARLRFTPWSIPDYYPSAPGAKRGGRSLEPALFDANELGVWRTKLRASPFYVIPMTLQEVLFQYGGHVRPQDLPAEVIVERMERGFVSCGNALVGPLLKSCLDRRIDIRLETRARALLIEAGRVIGLRAETDGGDLVVRSGAVILASGGFEWNDALKRRYLAGPVSHPSSPPTNEGDGLLMAEAAGAALGNTSEVWGSPAAAIPGEEYDGAALSRLVVPERACPHAILVNRRGDRFVNEGMTYNELGKVFDELDSTTGERTNLPCWTVFDSQYREQYAVLTVLPGDPDPEWMIRDEMVAGLARRAGIDAAGLTATIARWNAFVAQGHDDDFERHKAPIDLRGAHPSMGTIERPPFYALPVYQGTLGTKGGPVTNASGQVLATGGEPIAGLYAAGNVMASVAGPAYYGGGATIALAMTWGYICGTSASQTARDGGGIV
jgi:succinate dehydrogenase/fumarate reductase flavoprotein subunit